ncbi:hypothetical protein BGZ47_008344 [Haplosporangium gracile]|nr:hypothetical protein BGZ47_008344 [Haplosporangium gracile]
MRLDRFLRHRLTQDPHWTTLNNNIISKWLRKRQVKLVLPLSIFTPKDGTQLIASGYALDTEEMMDSAKTVTVTTATTRTVAGQLWRIRTIVEPDLADKEAGFAMGQIVASSGTDRVSHSTATVSSTDYLPLKDWVIYEDERIIVLNKPSGISVHGGTGVTTSIDSSLSLLQGSYQDKPRLVHRLDRTTSGILVLARTRKAAQDLASRFHEATSSDRKNDPSAPSRIQKKYLAIVGSAEPIKGDMLMITNGKVQTIQMASSGGSNSSLATKSVWPSATDVVIAAQNFHAGAGSTNFESTVLSYCMHRFLETSSILTTEPEQIAGKVLGYTFIWWSWN